MDAILTKLSEIEDAAERILDRTAEQKKVLAEEMRVQTESYDRELQDKHNRMMDEERESLRMQREEKLKNLRESMQEQMDQMDRKFGARQEELADGIVRRILEA